MIHTIITAYINTIYDTYHYHCLHKHHIWYITVTDYIKQVFIKWNMCVVNLSNVDSFHVLLLRTVLHNVIIWSQFNDKICVLSKLVLHHVLIWIHAGLHCHTNHIDEEHRLLTSFLPYCLSALAGDIAVFATVCCSMPYEQNDNLIH